VCYYTRVTIKSGKIGFTGTLSHILAQFLWRNSRGFTSGPPYIASTYKITFININVYKQNFETKHNTAFNVSVTQMISVGTLSHKISTTVNWVISRVVPKKIHSTRDINTSHGDRQVLEIKRRWQNATVFFAFRLHFVSIFLHNILTPLSFT